MGWARLGNGRIDRALGVNPSPFSSSSESEDEENDESESAADDESRVEWFRLPDEDVSEDELEVECSLVRRCSKTPSPKS